MDMERQRRILMKYRDQALLPVTEIMPRKLKAMRHLLHSQSSLTARKCPTSEMRPKPLPWRLPLTRASLCTLTLFPHASRKAAIRRTVWLFLRKMHRAARMAAKMSSRPMARSTLNITLELIRPIRTTIPTRNLLLAEGLRPDEAGLAAVADLQVACLEGGVGPRRGDQTDDHFQTALADRHRLELKAHRHLDGTLAVAHLRVDEVDLQARAGGRLEVEGRLETGATRVILATPARKAVVPMDGDAMNATAVDQETYHRAPAPRQVVDRTRPTALGKEDQVHLASVLRQCVLASNSKILLAASWIDRRQCDSTTLKQPRQMPSRARKLRNVNLRQSPRMSFLDYAARLSRCAMTMPHKWHLQEAS